MATPTKWAVTCQGTPQRGCGYRVVTPLPRLVIAARCGQCKRLRRSLLLEPMEEVDGV